MSVKKCDVSGCKNPATVEAVKLWGRGGSIFCCDDCKPDPNKRPEKPRRLPFTYLVKPIGGDAK